MVVVHSSYNDLELKKYSGFPIPDDKMIYIEDALRSFKQNSFYMCFDIDGDGDMIHLYLLSFIAECLRSITTEMNRMETDAKLQKIITGTLKMPGESGFLLENYCQSSNKDQELRKYLYDLRTELVNELLKRVYKNDFPDKWWLCFQKRRSFFNINSS
eukprot:GHVP01059981.1.p1 GENE.GHVP01059981.1~~GHVP01059981.1.p1  ORF type:complete len:158 (-),score=23.50 GHVP01059981.1:320-793(-)